MHRRASLVGEKTVLRPCLVPLRRYASFFDHFAQGFADSSSAPGPRRFKSSGLGRFGFKKRSLVVVVVVIILLYSVEVVFLVAISLYRAQNPNLRARPLARRSVAHVHAWRPPGSFCGRSLTLEPPSHCGHISLCCPGVYDCQRFVFRQMSRSAFGGALWAL